MYLPCKSPVGKTCSAEQIRPAKTPVFRKMPVVYEPTFQQVERACGGHRESATGDDSSAHVVCKPAGEPTD